MPDPKYILIDGPGGYELTIFNASIDHSYMASTQKGEVVTAGFISFMDGLDKPHCYGRSTSLDVKSDPERDTKILHRMLGYSK